MNTDQANSITLRAVRLLFVIIALCLWFWTQSLIGQRAFPEQGITDAVHELSAPLHDTLQDHPQAINGLLIITSLFIDLFGLFLLLSGIWGPTIRPFLGLVILFSLRQLCQSLTALPPPDGMIWHNPGFPSLLVTYGVSNDLFFSGHTAIAVYGAIELGRVGKKWLTLAGGTIALFEAATVLVLRAHYTMDVFTGAVAAGFVAIVAARIAPQVDLMLARLIGRN